MTAQQYEASSGFIRLVNHIAEISVTIDHISKLPKQAYVAYSENQALAPDAKSMMVTINEFGKSSIKDSDFIITDTIVGKKYTKTMKNLDLPEDEFHFFVSIDSAVRKIHSQTPDFLFEMATISAFAAFEVFVGDTIRSQIRKNPRLMGGNRDLKYDLIFEAESKEDILKGMIEREVRDIMFKPFAAILQILREKLGLSVLTDTYDAHAIELSLSRNCMLHNGSLVDDRLASASSRYTLGEKILSTDLETSNALNTLRKLAYAIDRATHNLDYKDHDA